MLRLTATSTSGEVFQTLPVNIPLNPGTYEDWTALTWPDVDDDDITGLTADPDQDGYKNLLEWALHLDPTKSDPFQPVLDLTAPGYFFTYTRRKTNPGEATFQVEWSDTLGNDWSTVGVGTPLPVSETATSETIAVPIPLNTTRRFFHVRVTHP